MMIKTLFFGFIVNNIFTINAFALTCPNTAKEAARIAIEWELSGRNYPAHTLCLDEPKLLQILEITHDPSTEVSMLSNSRKRKNGYSGVNRKDLRVNTPVLISPETSDYQVDYAFGKTLASLVFSWDPRKLVTGQSCISMTASPKTKLIYKDCLPKTKSDCP